MGGGDRSDLSLDGEVPGAGKEGTRGSRGEKVYKAVRPVSNVPGAVFIWGFPVAASPHRPQRTRKEPGFSRLKWD